MYSQILQTFKTIDIDRIRPLGFLKRETEWAKIACEKVVNGSGFIDIHTCPICKNNKYSIELNKFNINIYGCQKCGHRYSSKIPNNVEDVYSDKGYLPEMIEAVDKESDYRKERFGNERYELIKKFAKGNKLLDIGCGVGHYLEIAIKNNFEAYGQELGKDLAKWTREHLGITVYDEPIDKIQTDILFNVITIFDVIEHVIDPIKFISDAKRLLAKDGIILILTPNFDSVAITIMKEKWQVICPPSHLQYFTYNSVKKLADTVGMDLVHVQTNGIDLGDLKAYYDLLGDESKAKMCSAFYNILQPTIDASNAGNHFKFILQK
jgi:2-polyprenyl-3-methyl-5-hydroxy-6-metoxy-1,4-benzoquinol methylase